MSRENKHLHDVAAACLGKHGFAKAQDAQKAATRSNRAKSRTLNTYRCAHCGLFHIGANSRH